MIRSRYDDLCEEAAFRLWYIRAKGTEEHARDRWRVCSEDSVFDAVKAQGRAIIDGLIAKELI